MTYKEALILSAYTGYLLVPNFADVHEYCERILGRPIFTHEFAVEETQKEIRNKLKPQIIDMIKKLEEQP